MLTKLLFFPFRSLQVFVVFLYAMVYYGIARTFNRKNFDLGTFYQRHLERLGGTFIKVGQIFSVRYDVLPKDQCDALAKLQDNVKPFSQARGVRIIKQELQKSGITDFEIEHTAFASGSLCQVYRARDTEGNHYAIKVKRPFIEYKLFADTIFIKGIKYILIITGVGKKLRAHRLLDESVEVLRKELNYEQEVRHLELFEPISKSISGMVTPRVYPRNCTSRILVMEYVDGTPLSKYIREEADQPSKHEELCNRIYNVYITSMFGGGTFHADPHPGNIFIMNDGRIGIVDFGIVGVLNRDMRRKNIEYLLALSRGNTEQAAEIYLSILKPNHGSDVESLLRETKIELDVYLKRVQDPASGIGEKSAARLYTNSIVFARKYGFSFPDNVYLFYKTLFMLDNVLLKLSSHFDAKAQTATVLNRLAGERIQEEFTYDRFMERMHSMPEIWDGLHQFFLQPKTQSPSRRESNDENTASANWQKVASNLVTIMAIVFIGFYFSTNIAGEHLNPREAIAICAGALFMGWRLRP